MAGKVLCERLVEIRPKVGHLVYFNSSKVAELVIGSEYQNIHSLGLAIVN